MGRNQPTPRGDGAWERDAAQPDAHDAVAHDEHDAFSPVARKHAKYRQ